MGKVFISYRRDDSSYVTDVIYEKLVEKFGRKNIFKDVDNIRAGEDFREVIELQVQKCDMVLAIIGTQWLSVKNDAGDARLFDKNDFVRIELEMGLKRGIPIIPILVDNAFMPQEDELPETLKPLSYRNALSVRRQPDTLNDIERLIKSINHIVFPNKEKIRNLKIGLIITVLMIAGYTQHDKIANSIFSKKLSTIQETVKPLSIEKPVIVKDTDKQTLPKGYYIKVGSYRDPNVIVKKIKLINLKYKIIPIQSDKKLFRVLIGAYTTERDAQNDLFKVRHNVISSAYIMKVK